jgi:hypothetical protein
VNIIDFIEGDLHRLSFYTNFSIYIYFVQEITKTLLVKTNSVLNSQAYEKYYEPNFVSLQKV